MSLYVGFAIPSESSLCSLYRVFPSDKLAYSLPEHSAASCHYLFLSVLYILQGTLCKLRRLASDFVKKEAVCDKV